MAPVRRRAVLGACAALAVVAVFAQAQAPVGGVGLPQATASSATKAGRLAALTEPLVGVPYRWSPLGEGSGRDADPRLRWDAFDCTTFVETALAMLFTPSAEALGDTLDRPRYAEGRVAWDSRLHLIAAQWLPQMQRDGRLADVTEEIGAAETRTIVFEPKRDWAGSATSRRLGLPAERIPETVIRLAYLPWEEAESLLSRWPEPLVLNVVRTPTERQPLLVRHQALLLPGDSGPVVRHASQRLGRVVDQDLGGFVRSFATAPATVGLNAQRILSADR